MARIRVPAFPHAPALSGARLDALHEETRGSRTDLMVDFHELKLSAPPELSNHHGQLSERVRGHYLPRRLRFVDVKALQLTGLYTQLSDIPPHHGGRGVRGILHWRLPDEDTGYLFLNNFSNSDDLQFTARRCVAEARIGRAEPVEATRHWSPAPPIPTRYMYEPLKVHQHYGGDPVTVHLNNQRQPRRLFIGGLEYQTKHRPAVDAVLNLGEEPSRWHTRAHPHPADRWAKKGEGPHGMGLAEIIEEARWVSERLRAGQRVLVHCVAGFNRSVTIGCAVVMLLEHRSAEDALARVRQHHAWARPDSHHWLVLRWLAHSGASAWL